MSFRGKENKSVILNVVRNPAISLEVGEVYE